MDHAIPVYRNSFLGPGVGTGTRIRCRSSLPLLLIRSYPFFETLQAAEIPGGGISCRLVTFEPCEVREKVIHLIPFFRAPVVSPEISVTDSAFCHLSFTSLMSLKGTYF